MALDYGLLRKIFMGLVAGFAIWTTIICIVVLVANTEALVAMIIFLIIYLLIAALGFFGAHKENFAMILAYAIIQTVLLIGNGVYSGASGLGIVTILLSIVVCALAYYIAYELRQKGGKCFGA